MAFLGVKVIGDKELIRHLQDAPQQIAAEISQIFEGEIGPLIVETAQSIAPVKSGDFRDSIAAEVRGSGLLSDLVIGSDISYAYFIEFGTYKWKGKPTLRPALKQNEAAIRSAVQEAVTKALNW